MIIKFLFMINIKKPNLLLKKLIFSFFIYMILEGILRKWIFPNFHIQIYFIKDFFLIIIYLLAIKYNFLFKKKYSKYFILFIIITTLYGLIGYDFNKIDFLWKGTFSFLGLEN